jgi:thiosulfate/3-mercaptopyruvate sulfurtransferase
MLCTLPEVKSALRQAGRVVLDVRSKKEVIEGEVKEGAVKGGRIPGVTWIEWNEVLIAEGPLKGYWKSTEEIKRIFSAKGVTPEKEIYMY